MNVQRCGTPIIARIAAHMKRGHWIALALAGTVVTSCGGPSDEQRHADEARYTRAANGARDKASRAVARHEQRPKDIDRLSFSIRDTRAALADANDRLHRLYARMGDSSSSEIDAFDGALDPFLTAVDALTVRVLDDELAAAAAGVRRRGDTLYRAARAAGLRRCGRGGNALAERAVFVVYRRGYTNAERQTRRRVAHAMRVAGGADPSYNGRLNDALRRLYDSSGRLTPPSSLRTLHQRVRRTLARVLATLPDHTLSLQEFRVVQPVLRRYERSERQLRLKLNG